MRTEFGTGGVRRRDTLGLALGGGVLLTGIQAEGATAGASKPPQVRALVFDTFGTVVDWRTSVAGEVQAFAARHKLQIDGFKFADAWRAGYAPPSGPAELVVYLEDKAGRRVIYRGRRPE